MPYSNVTKKYNSSLSINQHEVSSAYEHIIIIIIIGTS